MLSHPELFEIAELWLGQFYFFKYAPTATLAADKSRFLNSAAFSSGAPHIQYSPQ